MGWWGERSYDNDSAQDALWDVINRGLKTIKKDKEDHLGVVVQLCGYDLPPSEWHLRKALSTAEKLLNDDYYLSNFNEPVVRSKILRDEIRMLEDYISQVY